MTHDQTTPAPVEVTQADREAAEAFWSAYCGGNDLAWRSLSAQSQRETMRAFARHRIAHSAPTGEVEPVAKRPHCEMCGKDVHEVLCPTCAKWWADNPPNPPAQDVAALEQVADDVHAALWKADKDGAALVEALKWLLEEYVSNVDSHRLGGFYLDPEKEECVIEARAVLAKHTRAQGER